MSPPAFARSIWIARWPARTIPTSLSDATVAARTARLCAVAEQSWRRVGGEAPVYVIGTEVPVPGGAQESLTELALTEPAAATATIDAHCAARFRPRDCTMSGRASSVSWCSRASSSTITRSSTSKLPRTADLVAVVEAQPYLVYEAHSTDYQTPGQSARAGAAALRDTEGRAGADLRHARGALGAGSNRARVAGRGAVVAAARDGSRGHDGDPAILEQILFVRRPAAGARSTVQPERSHPLLLADARGRRSGAESPAREPGREPAAAHSVEPVSAAAIRKRYAPARWIRAHASWCCMPSSRCCSSIPRPAPTRLS